MSFKFFGKKALAPSTDFSRFFIESSAAEKKKILIEVTKKANADQLNLYRSK